MKNYIKEAAALLLALFSALLIAALVNINVKAELPKDTDYNDHALSEQISKKARCEHRLGYWDDRLNQCLDQPLTDRQEAYLRGYVAALQQK